MGDLEENIFKQNIPGKYSTWDRDEVPEKGGGIGEQEDFSTSITFEQPTERSVGDNYAEEEALFKYAKQLAHAEVPESVRNSILADRAGRPATGVKGVLADYKASQRMKVAQREADAAFREAVLQRMARGHVVKSLIEESPSARQPVSAAAMPQQQCDSANSIGNTDELDEWDQLLEDGDDEEAFMRDFRARRLKELKIAQSNVQRHFSTVKEIGSADFISQIEEADPQVVVVVHLYESSVQSSVRMNKILEELAAAHICGIKFLRMHASANAVEVDRLTLPILTLYRGGSLMHSFVGIAQELGTEYFTSDDVQWMLESFLSDNAVAR